MQKLFSEVDGIPVMSQQTAKKIGMLKGMIIDPEDGKILAIALNKQFSKVISERDLLHFNKEVEILDSSNIIDPHELLRVKIVMRSEIKILGNFVVSELGEELGEVKDYYFDLDRLMLTKILVGKKMFGFLGNKVIIPRTEIVRIEKDRLVVKEKFAKENFKIKSSGIIKRRMGERAPAYSMAKNKD